ncbi:MAG: hypothetical protein JJE21_07690 [Spirochaetaceae bacterium]|nr:hypothetical protein [Spirochaetaceae bacterium]
MTKNYGGCWPTMITPFTDARKIGFKSVDNFVNSVAALILLYQTDKSLWVNNLFSI